MAAPIEEEHRLLDPSGAAVNKRGKDSRLCSGLGLLLALPCLVLLFVPLSKLLHYPVPIEIAMTSSYIREGDPYYETHPEAHGAAWQAAHGVWASQGASLASDPAYTPVGKTRSNGTHDFERTLIMISLDGVRADYLNRDLTPHLLSLSEKGIRAEYLQSSFPSLTFPNHWSIQTGLYPESHGIVANDFFDPNTGKEFTYTVPERSWSPEWWHGEPIWGTTHKNRMRSAVLMWPGPPKLSNGVQPTYWRPFVDKTEWKMKTDQISRWLDLPIHKRPNFLAVYLPEVDQQGHRTGPESDEVDGYLQYVDAFVKSVIDELEIRSLSDIVDVVVVSDHGMTSTANERVIYLDKVLGEDGFRAIEHKEGWPSCGLRFKEGTDEVEMLRRLRKAAEESNGGFRVFTHDTMPQQWHFSGNPRIAPIYVVPEVGWVVSSKEEHLDTMKGDYRPYGNHGYEPEHPDMHAIFVARGPFTTQLKAKRQSSTGQAYTIPAFPNVELYGLAVRLLGIPSSLWAPTNGTDMWDDYFDWSAW